MRAFLYSLAANISAFVGAIIGASLNNAKGVQPWILAFTAGNFLYIALSDLIPELLHEHELLPKSNLKWLMQNIGILMGMAIMYGMTFLNHGH